MSKTISFRGQLNMGLEDRIRLRTLQGKTGYKITKFQLMPSDPTNDNIEVIIQIWKTSAAAAGASATIDFSDNRMLAAGYIEDNAGDNVSFRTDLVIFDNEKFNQDIYISSVAPTATNAGTNYYIELEQMKLDLNEQTVATLKDIRNTGSQ